jgi:hypothetical protein
MEEKRQTPSAVNVKEKTICTSVPDNDFFFGTERLLSVPDGEISLILKSPEKVK